MNTKLFLVLPLLAGAALATVATRSPEPPPAAAEAPAPVLVVYQVGDADAHELSIITRDLFDVRARATRDNLLLVRGSQGDQAAIAGLLRELGPSPR